jgi:signal transduction histidine kinase
MYENETIPTLIDKGDALLAKERKYGPADLDEYLKTKETITSITQQIQDSGSRNKSIPLENAPHIFDYFSKKECRWKGEITNSARWKQDK